ncbi:hypothetical protein G9A89_010376 [Geosiphon pyriformis]|nr:hypothetical protein G9A89_010376 [Geosiphon pyriformis]
MEIAFEHQVMETPVNTESTRETFYKKLIQNTNLPTNHNFASIITEINKKIEHHTQQKYPITYTSKDKGKLQTPAVIPRKLQPPAWKKNRVESPSNPSYYYTPGSTINISLTNAFSSTATSAFGQFPFQNFGISDPWEAVESEKEEEESENQEFTYQHPITENPEVETLNLQTQQQLENPEIKTPNIRMPPNPRNQNPELINQQNLSPPPQPLNLDPMAYAPITKLDNFTGKENDAQIWLNDIEKAIAANGWNDDTANLWYQSLVNKPQDFNAFKAEFLRYFSNNNSINHLVNTFTTIKQGETETILNQFIRGLCSSILQHVRPLHPGMLQDAVTCTRNFEFAKSEANHAQAVNLVMNGSSKLDSKLENLHNDAIIKDILIVAKINHIYLHQLINSGNRKCVSATIVVTKNISKLTFQTPNYYPNQTINLLTASISTSDLSAAVTSNISTAATNHLSTPTNLNTTSESSSNDIRQPLIQSYSKLEIGNSCSPTNSPFARPTIKITHPEFGYQSHPKPKFPTLFKSPESNQHVPTNTILLATISSNKFLAAIFPFELEKNTPILLFSGATLKEKPITAIYMDARVNGHSIKLILDTASTRIITADGVTKTLIGEIDEFPFEVNGIVTPIKVLVMETTQYQAFVGNDWLSKVNAMLD